MWMCQNVGLAAGNLLMAIAIVTANWQKLADQAVAYAAEEEVRTASGMEGTVIRTSTPRCAARTRARRSPLLGMK